VTCASKLGVVGFLAMLHFASVISLLLIVDMQIMAYERRKFVMGLFFYRGFYIIENLFYFVVFPVNCCFGVLRLILNCTQPFSSNRSVFAAAHCEVHSNAFSYTNNSSRVQFHRLFIFTLSAWQRAIKNILCSFRQQITLIQHRSFLISGKYLIVDRRANFHK
jgi:hypothetical protein